MDERGPKLSCLQASLIATGCLGLLVGGDLLARAAIAAARQAASGEGDTPFLNAKVATAHFFATQLMPQAASLGQATRQGSAPLYAIPDDVLVA